MRDSIDLFKYMYSVYREAPRLLPEISCSLGRRRFYQVPPLLTKLLLIFGA